MNLNSAQTPSTADDWKQLIAKTSQPQMIFRRLLVWIAVAMVSAVPSFLLAIVSGHQNWPAYVAMLLGILLFAFMLATIPRPTIPQTRRTLLRHTTPPTPCPPTRDPIAAFTDLAIQPAEWITERGGVHTIPTVPPAATVEWSRVVMFLIDNINDKQDTARRETAFLLFLITPARTGPRSGGGGGIEHWPETSTGGAAYSSTDTSHS